MEVSNGTTSRKLDTFQDQRLGRSMSGRRTRSEVSGSGSLMVMTAAGNEHGRVGL